MENTIGKSGVPTAETHNVFDSTKIKTFMASPRGYFYEYVLGWRSEAPNIHFVFGGAWHEAMEIIHKDGFDAGSLKIAMQKFIDEFEKLYPDKDTWEQFYPKTPGVALNALMAYVETYKNKDREDEVLYTEVSGALPVSDENIVNFKLDTLIKNKNRYFSREHKTTSRMGLSWEKSWSINFQVDTYNYALNMLYPMLKESHGDGYPQGVVINGVGLYKSKSPQFQRVHIYKQENSILKYKIEANYWIDAIKREMELLADCSPDDPVMAAFPCNTEGCNNYGGCKIAHLCNNHFNPLQNLEIPSGMKVEHWDPRDQGKMKI